MFILDFLSELGDFLKEDAKPVQVGLGFAFGFLMAFQPFSLLSIIFFLIFFVIKINKAAGFFGLALFKPLALLVEPLAVMLGALLLEDSEALLPLWTALRNTPVVPFTRFYNTAVMGGLVIGIVGFVPVVLIFRQLTIVYNDKLREKIKKSKFMKAFMALPFVKIFFKVKSISD